MIGSADSERLMARAAEISQFIHSVDEPDQENQLYHLWRLHISVEDGSGPIYGSDSEMKKLLFVTASAAAFATTALPAFVAEAADQPVASKVQLADTSYPQCAEDPLDGICDLFFCLTDPACVQH
ncbi:hypothetical protein [Bradyrhizobium sp. 33ap4]|uniref:hypothetical protein n=1 Tax=Bradyrhizobium sp. 33ap4 TaxID=3061630 RepID=UPI00292E8587|nr:hypothetical protein [Bradyrhizobium sp. 33ap4]